MTHAYGGDRCFIPSVLAVAGEEGFDLGVKGWRIPE